VVDDNSDHREMMRELLQPLDFTVLTAADGPDCLTLIEAIRPDLFFVDISMPGMNGWELVEKLRASGQTAPILMLSANIGDDAARTSSDAGHNDAIAKPFAINQLLDKIAAHLGVEWLTDEPAAKRRAPRKPRPKARQKPRSPGPDHLKELFDLGQIGHVRGIDLKLRQLAEEPANAPLIELLRARIEVFDLEGYRQVLESVGEHDR
jgi:CheY-like chemotaxis protein